MMLHVAETRIPTQIENIDVAHFKEEPTLGNGIPFAIQLKGFNRMDRIGRRYDQKAKKISGSITSRPISEGAVMVVNGLTGRDFLSAQDSEYTLILPDSRGMATHEDGIYIGSVDRVIHINAQSGEKTILQHPWFAFIHSLQLTDNGKRILVTSPGFDRIIELDTDTGEPTWDWSAWTHGYPNTIKTNKIIVTSVADAAGKDNTLLIASPTDYQGGLGLPAGDRTAFPNSATYLNDKSILATLFHGGLIKIDKETGTTTLVLDGLSHPHGIRKYNSGFIVTDTAHGACIILDKDLRPIKKLSFGNLPGKTPEAQSDEWLQQVIPFNGDLLAAIDSHRAGLYILDPDNALIRRIPYDPNWAMQEVCPLSLQTVSGLVQLP